MIQKSANYIKSALLAMFVFAFGILSYGQAPPPDCPPPGGGGGGVGPGARPTTPVDMYIPLLVVLAIFFIALYAYKRTQLVK